MDQRHPVESNARPSTPPLEERTGVHWVVLFALGVAIALVPLVFSPALNGAYATPKITLFRLAVIVLCFAGFVWLAGTHRTLRFGWPHVALVAFLGWLFIGSLASPWPLASLLGTPTRYEGLLGFVGYGMIFFAATALDSAQVRILAWTAAGSAAIAGLGGLFERLSWIHFPGSQSYGARAQSTLGNPVFLGAFEATAMPLTLGLLLSARSRRQRVLAAAGLLAQLVGLAASGTRAAVIGVVIGSCLVLALAAALAGDRRVVSPRWSRWSLRSVYVGALVILVVAGIAMGLVAQRNREGGISLSSLTHDASSGARLEEWKGTLRLVAQRPLVGWGLDTFRAEFPTVRSLEAAKLEPAVADRPHNQWLYLAYAGGLPALVLYLAFLVLLYRQGLAWIFRRDNPAHLRKLLIIGTLGALTAYEVQSLFSFSLITVTPLAAFLQGSLLALTWQRSYRPHESSTREGRFVFTAPSALGIALGLALALLSVPYMLDGVRQVWADVQYTRAVRAPFSPSYLARLQSAASLSPRDPEYALTLGNAYLAAAQSDASLYVRAEEAYSNGPGRPTESDLGYSLALAYARANEYDAAVQTAADTLARDPYHAKTLKLMASLLMNQPSPTDSAQQVIRLLRTELSITPTDGDSWEHLGEAYALVGDGRLARSAYDQALTLDPANAAAANHLKALTATVTATP
jgi:O-antigen ligase